MSGGWWKRVFEDGVAVDSLLTVRTIIMLHLWPLTVCVLCLSVITTVHDHLLFTQSRIT